MEHTETRVTCKELILQKLKWSAMPLAVHEFNLEGYSQNNIATRLNECERAGLLKSRFREGKNFKEWSLQ
jgi:hypothetical protein